MNPRYQLHYYCDTCNKGICIPMGEDTTAQSQIFGTLKPCANKKERCKGQMMLWQVMPYAPPESESWVHPTQRDWHSIGRTICAAGVIAGLIITAIIIATCTHNQH